MKKIFTISIVVMIIIAANNINVTAQDETASFGPAPQEQLHNPPNIVSTDYASSRVWTLDGSGQFYKGFLGGCILTPVGTPNTFGFPAAMTYNPSNGKVYAIDQIGSFTMYSIDTVTGIRTALFNCSGMSFSNLTGIAWSIATNTMYGICSSLATSQIFSINMTSGVCTAIGSPTSIAAGCISISAPQSGTSLFAIDIVADNLYKFNRVTGVPTLVGTFGINVNYGQDAQFDLYDNKLYWASYSTAPQLRIIDTTNASSTVVCTYSITQATAIAIKPYTPIGINTYTKDAEIDVNPNPANNFVNISAQNMEIITILNTTGQVMQNIVVNNDNARIDVCMYDAGIYFVKVKTDKGLFTKKLIVSR